MCLSKKVVIAWSGGKDCTMSLHFIKNNPRFEIVGLLSVIKNNRIGMHNTHKLLIEEQAKNLDLPVYFVKYVNQVFYEKAMSKTLEILKNLGVECVVFGDIFLEDLKSYRKKKLAEIGMKAIFPLWQISTIQIINNFLKTASKAVITSIDSRIIDKKWLGSDLNIDFINSLPKNADPCGEKGEYHTFVYQTSLFKKSINYNLSNFHFENDFYSCDID